MSSGSPTDDHTQPPALGHAWQACPPQPPPSCGPAAARPGACPPACPAAATRNSQPAPPPPANERAPTVPCPRLPARPPRRPPGWREHPATGGGARHHPPAGGCRPERAVGRQATRSSSAARGLAAGARPAVRRQAAGSSAAARFACWRPPSPPWLQAPSPPWPRLGLRPACLPACRHPLAGRWWAAGVLLSRTGSGSRWRQRTFFFWSGALPSQQHCYTTPAYRHLRAASIVPSWACCGRISSPWIAFCQTCLTQGAGVRAGRGAHAAVLLRPAAACRIAPKPLDSTTVDDHATTFERKGVWGARRRHTSTLPPSRGESSNGRAARMWVGPGAAQLAGGFPRPIASQVPSTSISPRGGPLATLQPGQRAEERRCRRAQPPQPCFTAARHTPGRRGTGSAAGQQQQQSTGRPGHMNSRQGQSRPAPTAQNCHIWGRQAADGADA